VTNEAETRARAQAYGLLSRLVMVGLDEDGLALVRQLVPLAAALPDVDPDELAAAHHALFSMQAFPYESVYLDPAGHPGGPVSEAVADLYRRVGFGPKLDEVTADHLGIELGAMSFLCSAEADARRDGRADAMARCEDASRELIGRHLGTWLAPYSAAAAAEPRSFWTTVVELAVELVAGHADTLGLERVAAEVASPARQLLDDPDTGIKEISAFLCSPVEAGALFTRGDLERIGRALSVPTGFGSRAQRMQVLLESAAQYDTLPELCGALVDELETRRAHMTALPSVLGGSWSVRVEATQATLRRLEGEAERLAER